MQVAEESIEEKDKGKKTALKSLINSYLGSFSSAALHFLKKNLPFYLAFYMSDDLGFYPGHWEPCIVNILNYFTIILHCSEAS